MIPNLASADARYADDLRAIKAALGACSDDELCSIAEGTFGLPTLSRPIRAWLKDACEWELNRRCGSKTELWPPDDAVPSSEANVISIHSLIVLQRVSWQGNRPRTVVTLFEVLAKRFSGAKRAATM